MMNITANRVVLGCLVALTLAAPSIADGPAQQTGTTQSDKAQSDISARCQAMMAQREKMMADMKSADDRLDALVSTMNAASGQEKVNAVAAVVNELVAQRKMMRERMMSMQQDMMGHMAEHMQAGPESMAACPMMKGHMKQ